MENTIPKIVREWSVKYADKPIQYSKDDKGTFQPVSFKEFYFDSLVLASALKSLGVNRGAHVGLISENRKEWLLIDVAVLALGAADVPRGCDVTEGELSYILDFSDCETVFVENKAQYLKTLKVLDRLPKIKNIIIIEDMEVENPPVNVLTMKELMSRGSEEDREVIEEEINQGDADDVATIIFTSGTTGDPKGVMLTHENFIYQVRPTLERINIGPGDRWLCVLPVWHSFERIMQYISLINGCALGYSKPIGPIMLKDFENLKPTWMASVPRIWDSLMTGIYRKVNSAGGAKKVLFHFFVKVGSLHKQLDDMVKGIVPRFEERSRQKDLAFAILPWFLLFPLKFLGDVLVFKNIKKKLGGKFVCGISGGGALPAHVDQFFGAAGILLIEGYGLTESAPILALRYQKKPVPGTIGPAFPVTTELKVVDESGNILPAGEKGLLLARGGQIMKGYLKKPEMTAQVIDSEGWLNTGDLAVQTWDGEYKIVGRAKDTVVLLGGENIEPAPIEAKMAESSYILRAVVLGQDKKYLTALVVADVENLKIYAAENNITYMDEASLAEAPEIVELINKEISDRINASNGFKAFERIYRFKVLDKDFEVGKELSGKQDIKRHAIDEIYKEEIKELFNN